MLCMRELRLANQTSLLSVVRYWLLLVPFYSESVGSINCSFVFWIGIEFVPFPLYLQSMSCGFWAATHFNSTFFFLFTSSCHHNPFGTRECQHWFYPCLRYCRSWFLLLLWLISLYRFVIFLLSFVLFKFMTMLVRFLAYLTIASLCYC